MGRGGRRPGAGRPRTGSKHLSGLQEVKRKMTRVYYEDQEETWGWHDGRIICSVATGNRAASKIKALMNRIGIIADICEAFQVDDLNDESPLSEEEMAIAAANLVQMYGEDAIAEALGFATDGKRRVPPVLKAAGQVLGT